MLTRISDISDDIIHDEEEEEGEDDNAFLYYQLEAFIKKMNGLGDIPAINHKPYRAWRYTH